MSDSPAVSPLELSLTFPTPAPAGDALLGDPLQGATVTSPLAVRMRPRTLDELAGQRHLLGHGSPLRRLIGGDAPMSVVLWGPPGTGKTTIAHILSQATSRHFVALSALTAGVKDVRSVIDAARVRAASTGRATVLFIDEAHRFSKVQQDSLLAAVENRTVALIAATTENPSFSLVAPLLSRSLVLTLRPLEVDDIRDVLTRAVQDERGLAGALTLEADAAEHLAHLAAGDARWALTALEAAAGATAADGGTIIDLPCVERVSERSMLRYDADGDQHYDVTSAFIKSLRGSDVDASLHYLARMIEAGEDPRFIARRIVIAASEEVGMADPSALTTAVNAANTVALVGLPEAQLALAQAVIHIACAPKSNAVFTAIGAALEDVRAGKSGTVPAHLRDSHYARARTFGHGKGYRYPHDDALGVVAQQYLPDPLADRRYYVPKQVGAERTVAERLDKIRAILRRRR